MLPRRKDFLESQKSYHLNTGPATYSQLNLCPISGRHLLSKYVDTKLGKIDTKSKRFEYKKDTVPGPLDYKDIDALSR